MMKLSLYQLVQRVIDKRKKINRLGANTVEKNYSVVSFGNIKFSRENVKIRLFCIFFTKAL